MRAGLATLGIDYATQAGHELPQLNAVRIPEGVDDAAVRKALLERFGIEIGAGLGAFKGKVWRIGLMGYSSRPENVLKLLDCAGGVARGAKAAGRARCGGGRGTGSVGISLADWLARSFRSG